MAVRCVGRYVADSGDICGEMRPSPSIGAATFDGATPRWSAPRPRHRLQPVAARDGSRLTTDAISRDEGTGGRREWRRQRDGGWEAGGGDGEDGGDGVGIEYGCGGEGMCRERRRAEGGGNGAAAGAGVVEAARRRGLGNGRKDGCGAYYRTRIVGLAL